MPVLRRIWKQGNSSVISVPYYMLEQLHLDIGDYFEISVISDEAMMLVAKKKEVVAHRVNAKGRPYDDRKH